MRRSCISFTIFEDFISLILRVEVGVSQVSSKRFFRGGYFVSTVLQTPFRGGVFCLCRASSVFFFFS